MCSSTTECGHLFPKNFFTPSCKIFALILEYFPRSQFRIRSNGPLKKEPLSKLYRVTDYLPLKHHRLFRINKSLRRIILPLKTSEQILPMTLQLPNGTAFRSALCKAQRII